MMGKPCLEGKRFPVCFVLKMGAGETVGEILFPGTYYPGK